MKFALLTLFVLTSITYAREPQDCDDGTGLEDIKTIVDTVNNDVCPNPAKLRGICTAIANRTADPTAYPNFPHMYQRRILDASCVDVTKDSEAEIVSKIQKMWIELEDKLICNGMMFPVPNGNIIKYAVANSHSQFIADVARWKVNLNRVDPSDQKTVLDYILAEIVKHKGTALESQLRGYYMELRNNGAKLRSEL